MAMKSLLVLVVCCSTLSMALARPEVPVPSPHYGAPPPGSGPAPHHKYGPPPPPPPPPPSPSSLAPVPAEQYGPPAPSIAQLLPIYASPSSFYGVPQRHSEPQPTITKNIYVHVPPESPVVYQRPATIQAAVPKRHYKIIFIKAPNPPAPVRQVLPPPVQDEHKTLIYVLVKKPEEQQALVVPPPAPTEPSKPEVYFIKYREPSKPAQQYGPPAEEPATEYGPPPAQVENF